jgi:hypothetical protein
MISPKTRSILLLIIVSFLLALPALVASASAETIVRISPEVTRVSENGSFSLDVFIEPDAPVSGAEFVLTYDPSLVKIIRVSEGVFLKQEEEQTMFSPGSDNTNGTLSGVYGLVLGGEKALDAGTFANIEFIATGKEDIAHIELRDVTITNSTGTKLPAVIKNGRVLVGDVRDISPSSNTDQAKKAGYRQSALVIFAVAGMFLAAKKKL